MTIHHPRLSIRRMMILVAVSAVLCSGLRRGNQAGWHVGFDDHYRVGLCRNYGESMTWAPPHQIYQVGAWRGPRGIMLVGVEWGMGRAVIHFGPTGYHRVF